MSASRPARCLLSASQKIPSRLRGCRTFHASPNFNARRKPIAPSLTLEKMERQGISPAYTEAEQEILAKKYTPEQMAVIEAGEEALQEEDMSRQAKFRLDVMRMDYIDDLSITKPSVDRRRQYDGPLDPAGRPMDAMEQQEAYMRAYREVEAETPPIPELTAEEREDPEKVVQYNKDRFPSRLDAMKIESRMTIATGTNGPIPKEQDVDYSAPELPKNFEDDVEYEDDKYDLDDDKNGSEYDETEDETGIEEEKEPDPRDPDGTYDKLIHATGLTLDEIFSYKIKILVQHSVANQTRLGKVRSQYYLAICGDGNGKLGIGEAKGEAEGTMNLAKLAAIKNMKYIPRYENRTIFGEIEGKKSAVRVKLSARPPGFGLRCQHLIFEMCRACGIQDISARVPKARNKMNTIKAVYEALLTQRLPDDIARGRGKKLVDVRKVYYGGTIV